MSDGDRPETAACPDCDSANVNRRQTKPAEERWRCYDCDRVFREPVYRRAESAGVPTRGLAHALDKMDPDDIGGDA